jgi:molybdopterin-guanine dinucleotide biosynthesis protein A
MPESDGGLEPLHAVYGKGCLPAMQNSLSQGKSRIVECLDWQKVTVVPKEEVAAVDPEYSSFRNINTPEEYFRFREEMREEKQEDGSGENRG